MVSVKNIKIRLFSGLTKENLRQICRIERIPSSGKKDEIVERLAKKLSLKKTRNYSRKLGMSKKFSIFRHVLVPKHRILTEKEKQKLLKKYGITLKQLPRIGVRDPATMAINARRGDVIEMTRKSPTAGETKYYRVVVELKRR